MKSVLRIFFAAASFCVFTANAHAAAVTLDFDHLDGHGEAVTNFYNGSTGSFGSGPGPNDGITFSALPGSPHNAGATAICEDQGLCNDPASGNAIEIFGDQSSGIVRPGAEIHIANGFRGVFEFDASLGEVGGIGVELITSADALDPNATITDNFFNNDSSDPPNCDRLQCPFVHYSFNLAAHDPRLDPVAHDIVFLTAGTDVLYIDNLHFSDLSLPTDTPQGPPNSVPEPASWTLLAGGLGLSGVASLCRAQRVRGASKKWARRLRWALSRGLRSRDNPGGETLEDGARKNFAS